ncbi:BCCT family transporter [Psychrobacter aquaticus]|uniref:High-affinity choline uptake protein BetT n=1 Tax=Psychrobacter aquaticus CMS 56 TaxID=1354303 RepID=U4T9K5_9GAMM|nr:BCCT family transporter [Psychrobacter aquaticus]ERL55163.1 High-affinity choline uptake protein BetT [Psychrobacter aquaticus CMS 56]
MAIRPPLKELNIKTHDKGFYKGFNRFVTVTSKILVILVVVWILSDIERSGAMLNAMKNWSYTNLNGYYTYSIAFYILVCLTVILWPSFGRIKLGSDPNGKPEFSNFSWFSMIFGAGIGIGVLTYSAAEPLWHLANNPDLIMSKEVILSSLSTNGIALPAGADVFAFYQDQVAASALAPIDGLVLPRSEEALDTAFRYSFFHWGISAWSTYCLVGICLAFFAYARGLPLTMRSALTPLFGKHLEGPLGHVIDISAVIATIFGISQTIGIGLSSFASGMYSITGITWLVTDTANPEPTTGALLLSLFFVMCLSTASALSGVGRGVKWLSNINMVLSFLLLAFFLIFGASMFALEMLGKGILSYVVHLPAMVFTVWDPSTELGNWQTSWSIFYWAWWIAFAPFVGMFLARISKNRTIREFGLIGIVAPSLTLFVWFSFIGGTGIDLELSGIAGGKIFDSGLTAQLFEIIGFMLNPAMAGILSTMVVVLLLTYLVTSADSALLVVNTLNAAGKVEVENGAKHIIVWGIALTSVIAALILAGGLDAITSAMIVAAIPFSFIIILMAISLLKALILDIARAKGP